MEVHVAATKRRHKNPTRKDWNTMAASVTATKEEALIAVNA
jgi:uncharacterized protein YktB (UPF0637 family)